MENKKELSYEAFKALLLERHEEYKNHVKLKDSKILSSFEKSVKFLLEEVRKEKIIPYSVEEDKLHFIFIEILKEKNTDDEVGVLGKVSKLITDIDTHLGYPFMSQHS